MLLISIIFINLLVIPLIVGKPIQNQVKIDSLILLPASNSIKLVDDQETVQPKKQSKIQDPIIKWENAYKTPITYKLVKNEYMPQQFSSNENLKQLRLIIRKAFSVWEQSGDIRFQEVSLDQDAEIRISFQPKNHKRNDGTDCAPFDGPMRVGYMNTLAHAFYPGRRRVDKWFDPEDISGDLHFDADENWIYHKRILDSDNSDNPDNFLTTGQNIFATAVHELGHSLGFDHLTNPNHREAIMYPSIHSKWNYEDAYLHPADIELIKEKYGDRRNFFIRNWIAFVLMFGLIFIMFLWNFLVNKNIIKNDDRWKTMAVRRNFSMNRFSFSRGRLSSKEKQNQNYRPPLPPKDDVPITVRNDGVLADSAH